jgi:hypothetical protein
MTTKKAPTGEKKPKTTKANIKLAEQGDNIVAIEAANVEAVKEAKKHEFVCPETHPHLFDIFGNLI